jgi:hypothetical protein
MTTVDVLTPEEEWDAWAERYAFHLDQVPGLLEHIRTFAVPLKATRYDRVIVSGSHESAPLPFRVDAIDNADRLWSALVAYAEKVEDALGVPYRAPSVPRSRTSSDSRVLRADAFAVVAWLIECIDGVACHPELADDEDRLFRMIRAARGQYSGVPTKRRQRPRECPVCGRGLVKVSWETGENGRARRVAACSHCGTQYSSRGGA